VAVVSLEAQYLTREDPGGIRQVAEQETMGVMGVAAY